MVASCILPEFEIDSAATLARELFALEGPIRQLDGERDLNFLIGEPGNRFVFKIANAGESPAMLECQHRVFELVDQAGVFPLCATARPSVSGNYIETVQDAAGVAHVCRVLPFLEGRIFLDLDRVSLALLADIGHRLALLDRALEGFSHPALERPLLWKMERGPEIVAAYSPLLDSGRRLLVESFAHGFSKRVVPRGSGLRRAVIHNDANRANLLVDEQGTRLLSVIDFGDMVTGYLLAEVATAAAYTMLDHETPLEAGASLVRAYHEILPLEPLEFELLADLLAMRLCMSVCIAAHQCALQPDNAYLASDLDSAWDLLATLHDLGIGRITDVLRPA